MYLCMYARSLKSIVHVSVSSPESNLSNVQSFVYSAGLDVVFVSETWQNEGISDGEILPMGYNVFRSDRLYGRVGGGVLAVIKSELSVSTRFVYFF